MHVRRGAHHVLELFLHIIEAEREFGDGYGDVFAGRGEACALRRLGLAGLCRVRLSC